MWFFSFFICPSSFSTFYFKKKAGSGVIPFFLKKNLILAFSFGCFSPSLNSKDYAWVMWSKKYFRNKFQNVLAYHWLHLLFLCFIHHNSHTSSKYNETPSMWRHLNEAPRGGRGGQIKWSPSMHDNIKYDPQHYYLTFFHVYQWNHERFFCYDLSI